jgi:acetyl-CoA carboxylase carboxyl transferase subunit beta
VYTVDVCQVSKGPNMGLFGRSKPKIKISSTKKDGFSGWLKCTHCSELIHANELQGNLNCCPKCNYHYRLPVFDRVSLLTDEEGFTELFTNIYPQDPLKFSDLEAYKDRLKLAQAKTGASDAIVTGRATLDGVSYALAVLDFSFMGGSMGSVVGEKLSLLVEYASANHLPLVVVSTSGGARMQESTLSLMQMAKTAAVLAQLKEKNLLYISILTNPTTGGVTASFASLGDIILAEPNALICFAGPRVIEQILGKPLPEGAQQSEFLMKHGMIDSIVPRKELRKMLSSLLTFTTMSKERSL